MWDVLCLVFISLKLHLHMAVKGFLRRLTNLCELQRICYGTTKGTFPSAIFSTDHRLRDDRVSISILNGCARDLEFILVVTVAGYERTIRIETSLIRSKQLARVYSSLIKIPEQGRYTEANSAHALEVAVTGISLIKQVRDSGCSAALTLTAHGRRRRLLADRI